MERRLVFTGKQQVVMEEFDPSEMKPYEVGVRMLYSLMSTGTENIIYNRLFEPGTNFDGWVRYPFYPGYTCIGRIERVGTDVTGRNVGDLVVLRANHASYHVVSGDWCHPVPGGIDPRDAVWFSLAKITFNGARAAEHHLGDTVLVIGAGPIGQMSLRWAVASGAEKVVVVDASRRRLDIALAGGATHVFAKPVEECMDDVSGAIGGNLPRLVIDSTGNEHVFAHALKLARWKGRVLLIGDTGVPSQQHLTQDIICRGLTVVGAHDCHSDGEWCEARAYQLFFQMVLSGRFRMAGLNTHLFRPEQCGEAYGLVNTRRGETMGVIFDWTAGRGAAGRIDSVMQDAAGD